MDFENLNPHIRFVNVFSYFPKEDEYVMGYDYRIFYINDGRIFLNFKDSSITLEKHHLVLIPSEYPYKLTAYNGTSCEILCFNFDTVKGNLSETSVHPDSEEKFDYSKVFEKEKVTGVTSPIVISDATSISEILFEINREFQAKRLGYRRKAEALLISAIISIVRTSKEAPKKEVLLAGSVREYLLEHIGEECSAESIGEIFHYHPNYINRVFKKNFDTTIHNYLIKQRIKTAKELLATSNLSLEKIALKCGFKTLAHFSRCFKDNCGVSPSAFRKMSEIVII